MARDISLRGRVGSWLIERTLQQKRRLLTKLAPDLGDDLVDRPQAGESPGAPLFLRSTKRPCSLALVSIAARAPPLLCRDAASRPRPARQSSFLPKPWFSRLNSLLARAGASVTLQNLSTVTIAAMWHEPALA